MQIPVDIQQCVVFLGANLANGEHEIKGTGFWVSHPSAIEGRSWTYLVTAKHILSGLRKLCCETIGVRMNLVNGAAAWIELPIQGDQGWFEHPDDPTCDISVYWQRPEPEWDYRTFPVDRFVDAAYIRRNGFGPGDEVFSIGLFSRHPGNHRNLPIVRTGTVAAMETDDLPLGEHGELMRGYLIESRSIGGLSGSPVFTNLGILRMKNGALTNVEDDPHHLLGITWGHFNVESRGNPEGGAEQRERINSGIAIVTPASRIIEVLNHPTLRRNILMNDVRLTMEQQRTSD